MTVVKATPKKTSTAAATTPRSSLPASRKPTACIDFLYAHDAEVEFVSTTLNVQPACQSWARSTAKQGLLWTEQVPQVVPFTALSPVCSVSDDRGAITATVVDDGTQTYGQAACSGLIAAGWSTAPPAADQPITSAKPTGTTRLDFPQEPHGSYPHIEPSVLHFSADAGNVVTGIVWSQWSNTEAVGEGSSYLQSCIPNCAQGAQVPVSARITLLDPVQGHFTELLEDRNGTTSVASYKSKTGSLNPAVGFWPWDAS